MVSWTGLKDSNRYQHEELFDIKLSWEDILKLIGLDELCYLEIKEYRESP